ncbi:hypothetical protein BpHYR1_045734 [Brachionus plicatilis]|uniref:Uncharacterized protein n=1 Tax=Brachionus plicatilis TaxID=10195 RepID=A0A3M7PWF7_BRAPC|nr:hypothetical protein BpHYR1_045734 [Brachionus plicatilis]
MFVQISNPFITEKTIKIRLLENTLKMGYFPKIKPKFNFYSKKIIFTLIKKIEKAFFVRLKKSIELDAVIRFKFLDNKDPSDNFFHFHHMEPFFIPLSLDLFHYFHVIIMQNLSSEGSKHAFLSQL